MFATTLPLVVGFPAGIRDRVLPLVAETLAASDQTEAATALLDALKNDPALDLAREMLGDKQGGTAGALALYDRLAQSTDRLVHARATVRAVDLRLASGAITAKEAADRLDALLYAWRGDARERSLREQLAQLRARTGAWQSALGLLRETETLFPDDQTAIHGELTDIFAALLRGDTTDSLATFELASLVDENTDLLPSGPDGEALDLPLQAAPMLKKLMLAGPTAAGRAGFGARLAHSGCARRTPPARWRRWRRRTPRTCRLNWRSAGPCCLPMPARATVTPTARLPP